MSTLFTKIIDGEIPGRFVWKDERAVAFLTVGPVSDGHALVVPRQEIDHWLDADDELMAHLMRVARIVGAAQKDEFAAPRIGVLIQGFEVPHLHIHVFSAHGPADFDLSRAEADPDPARLDANAERLRAALTRAGHAEFVPA